MVVDEIDRAITQRLQVLELLDHVLGAARAPLAFVEDRDIAENAGPRTAARSLHGGEALHGQHRRARRGASTRRNRGAGSLGRGTAIDQDARSSARFGL